MSNNKDNKMNPIKSNVFALAEHSFRRFDCTIDAEQIKDEEDLTNPELWVNVSSKLNIGDEIRIVADDFSFVAYLIVTFTRGTDVRTKVISGHELNDPVTESDAEENETYEIKHTGRGKYCVVDKRDGSVVRKGPFDKMTAMRELNDYMKALLR